VEREDLEIIQTFIMPTLKPNMSRPSKISQMFYITVKILLRRPITLATSRALRLPRLIALPPANDLMAIPRIPLDPIKL
jgi:hypothetical protein